MWGKFLFYCFPKYHKISSKIEWDIAKNVNQSYAFLKSYSVKNGTVYCVKGTCNSKGWNRYSVKGTCNSKE